MNEKSDNGISKTIESIFNDSSEFIVVGLTGRTGSGCSTAAQILNENVLPLPDVINTHYQGNEIKKYNS